MIPLIALSQPGLIAAAVALVAAILLTFARLLRGPTLPDRVIALDLLSTLGVGIITLYAIAAHQPVYIDVAIVVALVSFLSTVAFARFIVKRSLVRRNSDA